MALLRIIHHTDLSGQAVRSAMCYSQYVSTILWPSMLSGVGHMSLNVNPCNRKDFAISQKEREHGCATS